jgi:hypothetical protein
MTTPPAGGRLIFYRRRTWQDAVRKYRIEVDGTPVGMLHPRGELSVDVEPGTRRVQARINWTGSPEVDVPVAPGQAVRVYVGPARGGLARATGLGRALSADSYLMLVPEVS